MKNHRLSRRSLYRKIADDDFLSVWLPWAIIIFGVFFTLGALLPRIF